MKSTHIHSQHWHLLTREQVLLLMDTEFGSSTRPPLNGSDVRVTIAPNEEMVQELIHQRAATLELVENRTGSTVYRIRQTGRVYQLCQPNGDLFEYESLDDYYADDPVDDLLTAYVLKSPKFTAEVKHGDVWVTHHDDPPFTAKWVGGLEGFENLSFPQATDPMAIARLMRKAGAFVANYFKNKDES